jgi:membrane-associated phospholipid phosphatase
MTQIQSIWFLHYNNNITFTWNIFIKIQELGLKVQMYFLCDNQTQTNSWSNFIFDPTCWFFWWFFFFREMEDYVTNSFFWKKSPENKNFITNLSNFNTFDYNMKGGLRFSTFIFWVFPKLAKHIFGWLPLEQHKKIENKIKSLIPIPTNQQIVK